MIGPMEEAVLKLPLFSHTYSSVLSTYVSMCSKGAILGAKIRICMSSTPSSGSFIVTSLVGLEEDTRRAWVAREKGNFQTNYLPYGSRHTPPIPDLNSWVVLMHMGGKGCNSWRWVVRLARLRTSFRQALRSSCTSVVSWTCLPVSLLRSCCTRVNMPLNPATAEVMLRSSPRSLHTFRSDV